MNKEPVKKKRVRKKKAAKKKVKKAKKLKETKVILPVRSTSTIPYKKSDYLEVDEEFRKDKDKKKEFHRQLEKGEIIWAFYSMDVHFYKKINTHGES